MNGKLKIFHLITGLQTGGAETMLAKLVGGMDKSRFENVVLNMSAGPSMLAGIIEKNGSRVETVAMRPVWRLPSGMAKLVSLIKREKPHILQTWLHHADFFGMLAARMAGDTPVLWNLRCAELAVEDHPKSLFYILQLLARNSALPEAVIVNSRAGLLAHEAIGYKPRRWEIIPNGFDVERFAPSDEKRRAARRQLGIGDKTPVIGLVARYHPMKDHATFLAAAGLVHKKRPDAVFVMAGTGVDSSNETIMSQIRREGLNGSIHALGEVADVPGITAALDIATCSSYSEGFPNVIGEAMACEVPCVVTDAGDSSEILGDYGVVVPPRDPSAMAEGILKLLAMSEVDRRELGRRARQKIVSNYSLEQITRRYQSLYEEIAGQRRQ
ncbi:MAG: glycosyltransferase [Nitrospinae bacterium]|nr:glycosyltransferase [Nitrospinota bacterium]